MSLAYWLNTTWMLSCRREAAAFRRATRRVAATQAEVLAGILRANRDTELGRRHRFDRITHPAEFEARVPITPYETLAPAIERIAVGQPNVLTREPVQLFQPTSGTTGGEKLIPYTAGLRRQFQRGVSTWIADLFYHRPVLRHGRAYWSISPALGVSRRTRGGIPIGFDDDAAYLGRFARLLLDRLLAVPASVARIADMEEFRYATLLFLFQARDLALISVWNPTFLTALLQPLDEWQERLCFDLRAVSPRRAGELAGIFRSTDSGPDRLRQIWPQLSLISCWTDAAAGRFLPELRRLFPHVEIQSKGLIATEAFVSFPLIDRPAPVLALRSHFFEFEEAGAGRCRLAHELERGGRYQVLVTTGGGLYRYPLRDQIEVVGFENQCPLIRFLGKADRTSDLVGEKLAEPFVRETLDRLFAAHKLAPSFALLVPVESAPPHYRLYVQAGELEHRLRFRADLQQALEENPHYRYACGLGQLAPVDVHWLDPNGEPGWKIYERQSLARGQKCGDIKPAALDHWTGWAAEFEAPAAATSDRR